MEEEKNEVEETEVEETEVDDTEDENTDSETGEVEETTDETNDEGELSKLRGELEAERKRNAMLYKRQKDLERKAPKSNKSGDTLTREEIILIAKGTSDELLDVAKMVSESKGVSLIEALKDPVVVAVKKQQEQEEKSKAASLGASGKGIQSSEPAYVPNQSRDEHKKAWEERRKK